MPTSSICGMSSTARESLTEVPGNGKDSDVGQRGGNDRDIDQVDEWKHGGETE